MHARRVRLELLLLIIVMAATTIACGSPLFSRDAGTPDPRCPGACGCVSCGPCQAALHVRLLAPDGGPIIEDASISSDAGYGYCASMPQQTCELDVDGPGTYSYTVWAEGFAPQDRTDVIPTRPARPGECCAPCPEENVAVTLIPLVELDGGTDAGADAGP